MTDTTLIEETPPVEPSATANPAPAPASDDFQSLIEEYTTGTQQEATPVEPDISAAPESAPEQTLDEQIAAILGPDPKIAELESQNAQLLERINNERLRHEYTDLVAKIQSDVPHVSERSIENALNAASINVEVAFAWRNQFADKAAANRELLQIEAHLQFDRNLDQQTRQRLEQRGYELGLILNAPKIIAREIGRIRKELSAEPDIDWSATYDRNMVAASVRDGGSGGKIPPSPPPDFGKMSEAEFRAYKKSIGLPD